MRLRILTPSALFLDEPTTRIVAEASNGSFGVLPRHADIVADLKAGVLIYETPEGAERFLGLDEGVLVKCGDLVTVATEGAIRGDDLTTLEAQIEAAFRQLDEHDRTARAALARLEAGLVRRFLELEKGIGG
ncbi:MAG: F0F1 ATP synthase subunit epsilon [Pseudomonadota bacterium]